MIYNNGWYYLLGTHGTCCDGVNSTYNIVVGRSRNVTGPFLDNMGRDMVAGGGKMVIGCADRQFGAGHFGLYNEDEGVQKFSFHWEADLDRSARSVLAIRPLVWVNDWPVAGEIVKSGTYEISSVRRGYALELAVDFVRQNIARAGGFGFGRSSEPQPNVVHPNQTLEEVVATWPEGDIPARVGDWMNRPHQRWTLTVVPEAGGYVGGQYYKIQIEGTEKTLSATADVDVKVAPSYTGADDQLWRIEQAVDGTYRIMPKSNPGYVLTSIADSTPTLTKWDADSDNCKWTFKAKN
jgi:arabinan endo-1,5-alpha-L-arabinosidase